MRDSLTTGPASANPTEHASLRKAHWREFYRRLGMRFARDRSLISAQDLSRGLAGRTAGQPVVLWSGGLWAELLFQWWACDALLRLDVPPSEVWLASTEGDFAQHAPGLGTPAHATDEQLFEIFAFSRRCTAREMRSAAQLWSAFAAGRLDALQEARTKAASAPPLGPIPVSASVMVPRVRRLDRRTRLYLSDYDERLLGFFSSGGWTSALACLSSLQTRPLFMSLLEGFGDLVIPVRLAEWASHAPDVLQTRPSSRPLNPLGAVEYRLTSKGNELLQQGLDRPTDAPQIALGGFVAYAADMKWACELQNGDWRFVRAPRSLS